MSRDDAPNFRKINHSKCCSNCKCNMYKREHGWLYCTKYNFILPKEGISSRCLDSYVCDGCDHYENE